MSEWQPIETAPFVPATPKIGSHRFKVATSLDGTVLVFEFHPTENRALRWIALPDPDDPDAHSCVQYHLPPPGTTG